MSLHVLARHLASEGRGPDTELVHMTRGEINGLQGLAVANGGSLTINPQTGLVEAGWLGNILRSPIAQTLAGAALTVLSGGAINPMMSAAIVGGVTGVATGSVKDGLVAGLGAWSGAGLAKGVMGLSGLPDKASVASKAASAEANAMGPGKPISSGRAGPGQMTPVVEGPLPAGANTPPSYRDIVKTTGEAITSAVKSAPSTMSSGIDRATSGLGNIIGTGESGTAAREAFWKDYKIPILATGASLLMNESQAGNNPQATTWQDQIIAPNTNSFDPNWSAHRAGTNISYRAPADTSERNYFTAKEGGLMGLANGGEANGPVEAMSLQNYVGQNTGYPMANQNTPSYSSGQIANPIVQNVLSLPGDGNMDPYTGEERFAAGGQAGRMLHNLSGMYGNAMHSN